MQNNINTKKQIRYGSIISYILIALNITLGLIYTPWIFKRIGSSNYGIYTLASSFISLFLMDFGMSSAVTRFVSKYRALNNEKAWNEVIGTAIKVYLIIIIIIAIILSIIFFNLEFIYSNLTSNELETFKVVYLITAFFVIICFPVNLCNGVLDAFEQFILLKISDIINKLGTVLVTMIALLLGGGISALVLINGIFNLFTLLLKILIIKKKTPIHPTFVKSKELIEMLSFSAWTTVQSISQQMIFNLIPSVLAMVANTMSITLYGFANTIEGYVYNITYAINGLFISEISRILKNKKNAIDILPLMIKVGRINQSVISLLLIGLTVLGKEFIVLWLGNEYKDLYYSIILLSIPYFISASQQIAASSIVVLNKVKYTAIITFLTGIINIILSYFIAGKYGVIGVCAVTCAVFFLKIFLQNIIYIKFLEIKLQIFFKECNLKMLIPTFISLLTSLLLNNYTLNKFGQCTNWFYFFLKVFFIILDYIFIMWLIGWNKYEKKLLFSFFKKL